jgi:hypothetical protein
MWGCNSPIAREVMIMVVPKRGRPQKQIDMDVLKECAKIQCTLGEIAAVCKISLSTLEQDVELLRIIDECRKDGVASIRHMQWQAASKGSADMLKWIGKQYAKQADKIEQKNDDRVTIVIAGDDKDV